MAKDLTIAQLIAAAAQIAPTKDEIELREIVKTNNLRTLPKLQRVIGEILVAEAAAAEAAANEAARLEEAAALAALENKVVAAATAAGLVGKRGRKPKNPADVKAVEAGPRGFRFGEVWNTAVKNATGVAVHPANFNKLVAQAKAAGLVVEDVTFSTELAKSLATQIAATL